MPNARFKCRIYKRKACFDTRNYSVGCGLCECDVRRTHISLPSSMIFELMYLKLIESFQ